MTIQVQLYYFNEQQTEPQPETGTIKDFNDITFKVVGCPYYEYATINELQKSNQRLQSLPPSQAGQDIIDVNNEVLQQIQNLTQL
jgi:hypothetical protein